VGERDDRRRLDIGSGESVPMGPGGQTRFDARIIDFGHHAGRTIEELVWER